MNDNQIQIVQAYCNAHGLVFYDHCTLVERFGGEEEWVGIVAIGAFDEVHGVPALILQDDETVKVVTKFADGRRHMEDVWTPVSVNSLSMLRCVHAT